MRGLGTGSLLEVVVGIVCVIDGKDGKICGEASCRWSER